MPTSKTETKKPAKTTVKKTAPVKAVKKAEKEVVKVEKTPKKSNITASVLSVDGKSTGTITLPSEIFNAKINPELMAQAVRVYLANQRVGTAHTKTRSEVAGTTKKVWRQKGTGRARHGSAKGPIFVGGGITFGPRKRDFSLDMSKKMKKAALFSALTSQYNDKNVIVLENNGITEKTKTVNSALKSLNLLNKKGKANKVLLVLGSDGKNTFKASRNIEGVTVENAGRLNTYDVLNNRHIVFLKDSIEALTKSFVSTKEK